MNKIERLGVDSELLRTFLAIAETGNLTHAAALLNRTQSAISVQLRKLEEALATQLFHRQARGMTLTENGHRLLPIARKLVTDINRISHLFSEGLSGRISIGVSDDYGLSVLEPTLKHFSVQHPDVEVSVRCSFSSSFPEAVKRGELDLALYTAEPDERIGKPLFQEPGVWVADESFYLPDDKPIPLALFDRQCWWRDVAIKALEEQGLPYRVAFSSESFAGVKAAISAGLAVGMLATRAMAPSMRILSEEEGMPALPASSMVLLINPASHSGLVEAMETAIRQAIQPMSPYLQS